MDRFEYKVMASPRRAKRVKGAKTTTDRFAHAMTDLINEQAADGWEYLRAETLPVDEKKGMLSAAQEAYHSVLVFRRAIKVERPTLTPEPSRVPPSAPIAQAAPQPEPVAEAPKPSPLRLDNTPQESIPPVPNIGPADQKY